VNIKTELKRLETSMDDLKRFIQEPEFGLMTWMGMLSGKLNEVESIIHKLKYGEEEQ